jgi:hypothetical protein
MRLRETTRIQNPSDNPNPGRRTKRLEGNSGAKDLIRWFFIIPIVWLLIFICSAISVMGATLPLPTDLLSRNHADYSPWSYAVIHPLREGFIEEIQYDFSFLDQTLSIFNQPSYVSDPFIKPTESVVKISVEATATSAPVILLTTTVTDEIGTDPTYTPTPSPTEDINASPTVSLTPSATNTPGPSPTPTASFTPSPTPTSSSTPSPTPSLTLTPSLTPTPSNTPVPSPTTKPTESINICSTYDYFHAHTPYSSNNIFGYIVHAMPVSGPETQVVVTGVTVNQDSDNPTILTVNKLNWYHTGMGSTSVNVGKNSESVHVSTNLTFYACYPAGQCDHSYYGGFIEAEFDGTLDGGYSMEITVNFPEYGQTCRITKGITK